LFTLQALTRALAVEGLLVGFCFLAFIALRWRVDARRREVDAATWTLEPLIHAWLVLDADIGPVVASLRRLRPHAAFRGLARLATQHVTFEHQQRLAAALRGEAWVAAILRHAASPLWWRRFDAARLLSIVGGEGDVACIASLLDDRSPAVRLVAMDAAARLQGRPLVDRELDTLPRRQDAVQAYQWATLSRHPVLVGDALIARLTADAPTASLNAWIDAAGALANPTALVRVRELASHDLPEVRLHVARALRRLADPDTPAVLARLLHDTDWRVRAQGARALGALRCGASIVALSQAVRDRSWWVRYRSALALAQIGGPAREALVGLTRCDDPMARDMSTLVAGLSSAAVVEMSEV
jgi:HEAT repeat protein